MTKAQLATLRYLCAEPGLPKWHYWRLSDLPADYYQIRQPKTAAMFSSTAHPTKAGKAALALAAAASGGDVKQAPGEAPQSGPNASEGNAQ